LEFLVEVAREMPPIPVALDFGCGPTVHRLFPLVSRVGEIHVADYLGPNRTAVRRWLERRDGTHDWRPFIRETLGMEGYTAPTAAEVEEREEATRARVTQVLPGDAAEVNPLGPERRAFYPLVTSHYCADSATDDMSVWRTYMRHIAGLVQPGGLFVVSALGSTRRYRVGSRWFPSADVTAHDLGGFLQSAGFRDIDLRVRVVGDREEQGYGSVLFARAVRRSVE
jgi:hypothetical protein